MTRDKLQAKGSTGTPASTARFRGHRGFAAFWQWTTDHEGEEERGLRRDLVAKLSGRVLEIGFGVGTNWQYLPKGIDYVGIEPDPFMLERAIKRAPATDPPLDLRPGRAEALPFGDGEFDNVLVTLTFCTIEDPATALSEIQRVLKPGGELLFLEHVRPEGRKGWFMDRITPLWRRVGGGCHPNRRTLKTLEASGLAVRPDISQSLRGLPLIAGGARKANS